MIVPLTTFLFDKNDAIDMVTEIIVAFAVFSVFLLCDATCVDGVCCSEVTVPVTKGNYSLGAGQEDGELVGFLSFLKFQ